MKSRKKQDRNRIVQFYKTFPKFIEFIKNNFYCLGSPLHFAAKSDNAALVEMLISAGANVNARNESGFTPLFEAARSHRDNGIVQILIQAGADIASVDDLAYGKTTLDWAERDLDDALSRSSYSSRHSPRAVRQFYLPTITPLRQALAFKQVKPHLLLNQIVTKPQRRAQP